MSVYTAINARKKERHEDKSKTEKKNKKWINCHGNASESTDLPTKSKANDQPRYDFRQYAKQLEDAKLLGVLESRIMNNRSIDFHWEAIVYRQHQSWTITKNPVII